MNGTPYLSTADWHDALIARWRQEWLIAIEDCLRPAPKETA